MSAGTRFVGVGPWPRGDVTLRRMLDQGYQRPAIAAELSRELRTTITADQVTNRGRRKGWIVVQAPKLPKGLIAVTPQRLTSIVAATVETKPARTCQDPMWRDRTDATFGKFCGAVCVAGSSYCAEHKAKNTMKE